MRTSRTAKDSNRGHVEGNYIIYAAETDNVDGIRKNIEAGIDINFVEEGSGITPLHAACARNSVNVVKELFEYGERLDTSIRDNNGRTALDVAIEAENFQLADFVYQKMFPENFPTQDPSA